MLGLLARPRSYRALVHHRIDRLVLSVPALHCHPRTMSSPAVASSSQPSALENGPLAGPREAKKQQAKEKKDKAQTVVSQYPLEVRTTTVIDSDHDDVNDAAERSFNHPPTTSISGFNCLSGCAPSMSSLSRVRWRPLVRSGVLRWVL